MKEAQLNKESVFDYAIRVKHPDGKWKYVLKKDIKYYSKRYKKWIIAKKWDKFDGATDAPDIDSFGWLFHDILCRDGFFADGTSCNNWQASSVLSDILKEEGRWVRRHTWFWATWLLGGGKARDNGLL